MAGLHEPVEVSLERSDFSHRYIVHIAVDNGIENHDLLFHRHRDILALLQDFLDTFAAFELRAGSLIELGGAELGESRYLAVLAHVQLEPASHLLHGRGLGLAADAGHRDAHVQGRLDTGVK